MKQNLFLSVASVFVVLHLCKAIPLRHFQKRAAFYIANETACVVDNIVYSNGDPIPTDDPCEACRCRPPGFACVLKECRIKPGCRAVRHVGQCCPEYICGCEHNGKMYRDGDEIRDPKNPCYKCHCQGSSIACAFVDCIFRDDCDTAFEPGECCPKYTNCTGDVPDRNQFTENNALPPINLLPALNDESILVGDNPYTTQRSEQSEIPTKPTQPPQNTNNNEERITLENIESTELPHDSHTTEPQSLITEESKSGLETAETEILEETSNKDKDLPEEKDVETIDETKILFNSETEIKEDDDTKSSIVKEGQPETTVEVVKEEPQTTEKSVTKVTESEAEETEKPPVTETISTEIPEREFQVKNSASENSKSLKLTDDDQSRNLSKEIELQNDKSEKTEDKLEDAKTELPFESTSEIQTLLSTTITDNKPESEENIAEESQTNPQATQFYSSNERIKSESAETVTIVVHVKEKAKPSTDFHTESIVPESVTTATQEDILKTSDETETKKETPKVEEVESISENFEIFPTSEKVGEVELSTDSPSIDPTSEDKPQERSDEIDIMTSDAEENSKSENNVSDSKNVEKLSPTTTNVSEVSKETRADEVTEVTKENKPTSTVIRIDPNGPITIEIINDSQKSLKLEETTKGIENEKTTEDVKLEEMITGTKPEVREDESQEEKVVETTPEETKLTPEESTQKEKNEFTATEKVDESTTEKIQESTTEKIQESTTTQINNIPEERADETHSQENTETTNTGNKETEENKSEETTESQNQQTEVTSNKD